MIDNGIVSGDKEMAIPVYFGKTYVYVHTDITETLIEEDPDNPDNPDSTYTPEKDEDGNIIPRYSYTYHEYLYSYTEYAQILQEENSKLKENVMNTQMALLELYESME